MNGPDDWLTTAGLGLSFGVLLAAAVAALRRVFRTEESPSRISRWAATVATLICVCVLLYRYLIVHNTWAPLESQVDGLLLLVTLLSATAAYLQWTARLPGLEAFLLPLTALTALWSVCSSWWSFRPIEIRSLWHGFHLVCVVVGSLDVLLAATAGALWLLVDHHLRRKDHRAERFRLLRKLGDLESIENMMMRQATVAFVLLTLVLLTGLIITTGGPTRLGAGWWLNPKVLLGAAVWSIFAFVMHVRFLPLFRGRRAAVLSIIGAVVLLMVVAIAQTLPPLPADPAASEPVPVNGEGR